MAAFTNPAASIRSVAAMLLAASVLAACDNPVTPDEHAHPEGVLVIAGTDTIASLDDTVVTGGIDLTVGDSRAVTVVFVDHDGDPVEIDADLHLEAEVANTSIATFTPSSTGSFTGTFNGVSPGTTTVLLKLMHGTHADFTPQRGIPIMVAP